MFFLGNYVKISNTNIYGYLYSISKQQCTILSNDKFVKTNLANIEEAIAPIQNIKRSIQIKLSSEFNDELMLRHQNVEDALFHLDKFIDNAICNKITIIKIIHGKKGGILRKEVQKYLTNHPAIKEHRLGDYYEGSYGVTIAFLK